MTQRSRYLCMLFAYCLIAFSSCEMNEMAPEVQKSLTPVLVEQDCTLDINYWFPLQSHATGGDWRGEYVFELETGVFYSNDCLCQADRYEIGFTTIPSNASVVARNIDGDVVTSFLETPDPINSEVYTLVIPAFEEIHDELVTVFVDFDAAAVPLPVVALAGGLCITENYGGVGDPPKKYTGAILVQTDNYPPGTGSTNKIWLPVAIGMPVL